MKPWNEEDHPRDERGRFVRKIREYVKGGGEIPLLPDGRIDLHRFLDWADRQNKGKRFTKWDFGVFCREAMRRSSSGQAREPIDWAYTANHIVLYYTGTTHILKILDIETFEKYLPQIRKGIEKWIQD